MPVIKGFGAWSSQIYESKLHRDFWYISEASLTDQAGLGSSKSGGVDPNRAHPNLGWDPEVISRVEAMADSTVLKKAEDIISLCRIKIFERLEWFKPYWDIMPPQPHFLAGSRLSDKIGTMDTSGSAIRYCPRFVLYTFEFAKKHMKGAKTTGSPWQLMKNGEKWFNDYTTFVLIHEIMHNSLKHFLRTRQQNVVSQYVSPAEIHSLWNLAQDYEINRIIKSMLGDMVEMFPGGVDHEEGGFKAPSGEEDFFGQASSERIFYRLLRNVEAARSKKEEPEDSTENDSESPGEFPIQEGDIVELKSRPGEYGEVISVSGDPSNPEDADVEIRPITEEEAMERTGMGQQIIYIDDLDDDSTGDSTGDSTVGGKYDPMDDEINRLLGDIDLSEI